MNDDWMPEYEDYEYTIISYIRENKTGKQVTSYSENFPTQVNADEAANYLSICMGNYEYSTKERDLGKDIGLFRDPDDPVGSLDKFL